MYLEIPEFKAFGTTLVMTCEIGEKTPGQLRKAFARHPGIKTILLNLVPGTLDDEINLALASWVAEKKLTTRVNRYSYIASGGTDFFLAGKKRIVENGALIGIHSWGTFGEKASDYPRGHAYHMPYIGYYQQIGFTREQAEEYYYFCIHAATPDEMHYLTNEEIVRFGITTTGITPAKYYVPELEDLREDELDARATTPGQARRMGLKTISEKEYLDILFPRGKSSVVRRW